MFFSVVPGLLNRHWQFFGVYFSSTLTCLLTEVRIFFFLILLHSCSGAALHVDHQLLLHFLSRFSHLIGCQLWAQGRLYRSLGYSKQEMPWSRWSFGPIPVWRSALLGKLGSLRLLRLSICSHNAFLLSIGRWEEPLKKKNWSINTLKDKNRFVPVEVDPQLLTP